MHEQGSGGLRIEYLATLLAGGSRAYDHITDVCIYIHRIDVGWGTRGVCAGRSIPGIKSSSSWLNNR